MAEDNTSQLWTKILEKDGITIYSQKKKEGIIPFKSEGIIDVNIEDALKILKDFDNKHLWAPKLKSVKTHKKLSENEYIFSEYYKTPWPATDREFLLKGFLSEKKGIYFINAKSIANKVFEDENHIQADVKKLNLSLEKVSETQTKISFEFHGDMKGWMPHWLINLIQKKWPFKFIKGLVTRVDLIKKSK